MMVLFLVALLYSMITFAVIQVAQVTRAGSVGAIRKKDLLKANERLRWQLRGLFLDPNGGIGGGNTTTTNTTTNTTATVDPRLATRLPGIIGTPGASIYAKTDSAGQDYIFFLTTAPTLIRNVTEVGYRVLTNADGKTNLVYRQFPVRSIGGFHDLPDTQEGPWTVLLTNVKKLTLDYSLDGLTWERQWDDVNMPRRIHVHLETSGGEVLDYQVTPGTGAGRW
jgi:hypothetical protein